MTSIRDAGELIRDRSAASSAPCDETLLHLLAATSPIVFTCGPGPDYAFESITDNVIGCLGCSAQELIDDARYWTSHVHPEDRPDVLEALAVFPWHGERVLTYRFRHKDGSCRKIQDRRRVIVGAEGSKAITAGYWMDVTWEIGEHTEAERKDILFRHLIEHSSDIIVVLNETGSVTYISPAVKRIFSFEQAEVIGSSAFDFFHPEDSHVARQAIKELLAQPGSIGVLRIRCLHKNGSWRHMEGIGKAVQDDPQHLEIIWNARDITENTKSEDELRKLSQAVEQSPVTVMITDLAGRIEYVNPKFEEVTGYRREEVLGRNPRFLKSGHTSQQQYELLWEKISSGQEWLGEFHNRKKNGDLFWEHARISPIRGPNGSITHFLAVKEDITARKGFEERLIHQARFDNLTGLPNRVSALDRLSCATVRARRENRLGALLFVDVDHFKNINDALGHAAGDELLAEMARRLIPIVRESDTVARFGGDEFLVILEDVQEPGEVEIVVGRILDGVSGLYRVRSEEVFVGVSIGITLFPADGTDSGVLMSNADAAMYSAKEAGRNRHQFFSPTMNERIAARVALEKSLRPALGRNEFVVHYQPIVEVQSGIVVGAEALVRWEASGMGPIPPEQFVPVAEGIGLIVPIGSWVLARACHDMAQWTKQFGIPLRVAVNVSARQVKEANVLKIVSDALRQSGLAAHCLELEITENLLLEDDDETAAKLEELNEMGVRLSLDDFGTGYSSLNCLRRFPFDVVKIDRRFVNRASKDLKASALVGSIVAMAHALGLEVVAEGVEASDDLELLRAQGCDLTQGYFFSRPLTPNSFAQFLKSRLPDSASRQDFALSVGGGRAILPGAENLELGFSALPTR